jgi:TolB-like protein/DNA-binding winged helix-turn-helix (wHTH) protein
MPFRVGGWEVDPASHTLSGPAGPTRLEPKVLGVLVCLAEHHGRVVSKDQLIAHAWAGTFVGDDVLTRAVSQLRRAFQDDPHHPRVIETIPKGGYRLIAPVTFDSPAAVASPHPARVLELVRSESGRAAAAALREAVEPEADSQPVPEPSPFPAARRGRARLSTRPFVLAGLVLAVALGVAAVTTLRPGGTPASAQVRSLAVLPLEDASDGPAYFADGLTEEITNEISRLARLQKVINRRSVMQYKGSTKTASAIAKELGVDALVTGTVFRIGDRVRVTAQLVDGRDDRVLWAGTAERALGDVLLLHRELVRDLMRAADLQPLPGARETVDWVDPAAYDAYLRGLDGFDTYTAPSMRAALVALGDAVERDPGFARAHALLAMASIHGGMMGLDPPHAPARAAADRALALDATIGEAHAAKGFMLDVWEWQWRAAEEAHRRAVELAPNSSLVRMAAAHHFGMLGRYDEALREARWAVALNPTAPATRGELAWALLHARRFEEAGAILRGVVGDADPQEPFAEFGLTLVEYCDARLGRVTAACARGADRPVCGLAQAMAGDVDEGQRVLRTSCGPFDTPRDLGSGYSNRCLQLAAALGDLEPLLRFAELAARERWVIGGFLLGPDTYDVLHDEPRFQAVLRQVGLAQ